MKWTRTECQDHKRIIWERVFQNMEDFDNRIKALEEGSNSNENSNESQQSLENGSNSNGGSNEPQQPQSPTTRTLSFTINDGTDAIEGASVKIGATTKTTGSAGGCTFTDMADDTYSVEVSKEGYTTKTESITSDETHTSFTISLTASSP